MKQYLNLLQDILDNGQREPNRTGIDTLTLPGAMLKFDLRDGFPAVTTKKLAFKAVVGELIGFLRGSRSLAEFKALGCDVWDANVKADAWQDNPACLNRTDMGRIYGTLWRDWHGIRHVAQDEDIGGPGICIERIDQIKVVLDQLRNNPESRRIIVNAWNAVDIKDACLPPCHVLFQLLPRSDGTLHMTMYQRSCDMFLGVPFNIASYALLLELFAAWSGRTAATLTMFLADAHIYVNHIDQVKEQLGRPVYPLPTLEISHIVDVARGRLDQILDHLHPDDFQLIGYQHHAAIKAPMAV
jgi:thymidylate synthase